MNRLVEEVVEICCGDFKDGKQAAKFKANFLKNLNMLQNEFASYKRQASVPLDEQLQYQFGKRITSRFGLGIDICLVVVAVLTADEILLNIPGLLIDG